MLKKIATKHRSSLDAIEEEKLNNFNFWILLEWAKFEEWKPNWKPKQRI